jgi:hypothetical protein
MVPTSLQNVSPPEPPLFLNILDPLSLNRIVIFVVVVPRKEGYVGHDASARTTPEDSDAGLLKKKYRLPVAFIDDAALAGIPAELSPDLPVAIDCLIRFPGDRSIVH